MCSATESQPPLFAQAGRDRGKSPSNDGGARFWEGVYQRDKPIAVTATSRLPSMLQPWSQVTEAVEEMLTKLRHSLGRRPGSNKAGSGPLSGVARVGGCAEYSAFRTEVAPRPLHKLFK